jgi:hypothetical protein
MHHQCQRHSDSVYIEELQINQEYENQNPPEKKNQNASGSRGVFASNRNPYSNVFLFFRDNTMTARIYIVLNGN